MKLQLNRVKKDYISNRYIPFNIKRKLILLTLMLMPKPDFKVHLWKTAAHTRPRISACLHIWIQPSYLLKWKHNVLSQSSLVLLCPNWQEHTRSYTVFPGWPCFPWVDNMSDSPEVNWAVLCVWQKGYKCSPLLFAIICTQNRSVSHQIWISSDSSNKHSSSLRRQWWNTHIEATCTNVPLTSEEMLHH